MRADRIPLALLLTLAGVYRLSLLGRGAVTFVDETLYFKAAMALRALAARDVRRAVFDLVTNNARPGDALVKMVPASLQAVALAMGYPVLHPTSLLIPTACNAVVSLIVVWLLYRVCKIASDGDTAAALTAAAVYAMLPSSNVYIRHLFPYDWALAVALWALWLAMSRALIPRRTVAIGFLAGSVPVIYPGYYPVVAVIGAALVVRRAPIVLVAACVATPVLLTEVFARWAGFSYLASARELSGTIVGGSFDEGWRFLPRYLVEVDRAGGLVLIVGVAAYVLVAARETITTRSVALAQWILAAAAAGWVWQALLATLGRKMVLYGRLVHPWIAMLALALAVALHAVPSRQLKAACCWVALFVSFAGFAWSARQYDQIAYPRDVLHALAIEAANVSASRRICEFESTQVYGAPPPSRHDAPPRAADALMLINFCQGNPTADRAAAVPVSAQPLFDAPHFERYPAYQFEGYTPDQRRLLQTRDYRVVVYRLR